MEHIPTVDEWKAELEHLTHDDPGLTVKELAEQAGVGRTMMQCLLNRGVKEGRYLDGKAHRPGVKGFVKVYRIARPATSPPVRAKPKRSPRTSGANR